MNAIQERREMRPELQHRVLIVEDEPSIAKGLAMVMREEGYDVDMSDTGRSAIEKFGRSPFDLLVADLRLPDLDGMDVIRHVRTKRPSTKVIVITGYPSVSSALQAVKMGASDYLRKPFSDDEFMVSVKSVFAERGASPMEPLPEVEPRQERLIQKGEVQRVLERAYQDGKFWRELMENQPGTLQEYHLSSEAQAAIFSGDLRWMQKNIGEMTREQLMFINSRLEREAW